MSNEELIADLIADLHESAAQTYESLSQATIDVLNRAIAALEAQSAPLVADSREALARAITDHRVAGPSEGEPSDEMVEHFGGALADHLLAPGVVSLAADRDRAMKAQGWDECIAEVRSEIRALPSWASPNGEHGFDLQPLGPDASTEEGARVAVFGVLDAAVNPYRESEGK